MDEEQIILMSKNLVNQVLVALMDEYPEADLLRGKQGWTDFLDDLHLQVQKILLRRILR